MDRDKTSSSGALASLAAIGSVLAATSCCLPVLPFLLAASAAGGSVVLWAARPYLLVLSLVFIGYGFYQSSQAKKCQRRPSLTNSILLWTSASIVVLSFLAPPLVSSGLFGGSKTPPGQPALTSLTPQNISELKSDFNSAKDSPRIVLLLSPT